MRICTDFRGFNGGYRVRPFIFRGQAAERTDAGAPGRWKLAKGRQGHFAGQGLVDSPSFVWGKKHEKPLTAGLGIVLRSIHIIHILRQLFQLIRLCKYTGTLHILYILSITSASAPTAGKVRDKSVRASGAIPASVGLRGKLPDQNNSAINSFVEITPSSSRKTNIFDGSAKNIWGVQEMDPPKLLLLNEDTPILDNPHILWVPLKTCSTKKFLAQRVHRTSSNGTRKRKEPSELLASPMEIYEIPPPETLILYWVRSCRWPRGQVPVNGSPWGWFPRFQPQRGWL